MFFDGLIGECKYDGNKQRLNLSNQAYAILTNDCSIFGEEDQEKITSALINRIFCNYADAAKASAAVVLQNRRSELAQLLEEISSDTERRRIIDILIKEETKKLANEIHPLLQGKGNSLVIRLNKDALEYLSSDIAQREAVFYNKNVGQYVKAIIEEYASLPYIERERIYYKEWVDEITKALADRKLLKIELKTTSKQNGIVKQNISYVKPYAMRCDTENLYNYLIGYESTSPEGPWKIKSIRLSSINKCKKLEQNVSLSSDAKKEIERAICQKGVQFLASDKSTRIVVEFTEEGEKQYQRFLHLRPAYISKNNLIYEFDCTIFQALAYFFKFGHDVKILEPDTLAQKFYRKYTSAANQYRKSAIEKHE